MPRIAWVWLAASVALMLAAGSLGPGADLWVYALGGVAFLAFFAHAKQALGLTSWWIPGWTLAGVGIAVFGAMRPVDDPVGPAAGIAAAACLMIAGRSLSDTWAIKQR